jgi:hypothetical protein
MRFMGKYSFLLLGVLLCGCGPGFDPPDQLHSLRILGVEKSKPYAKPGETVNLQMLWEDASPKAGRAVELTWSGPCLDPQGDLYYGCFSKDRLPDLINGLTHDATTQFVMPASYVPSPGASEQPVIRTTTTGNNAPYGIAFVFFAACAGKLTAITAPDPTALPFACLDDAGNQLGSDDFVAGYTSIYSYADFSNNNPVISGFEFNGQKLDPTMFCLGDDCLPIAEASSAADIDCTGSPPDPRCIPTCSDDGKSACHGYAIRPTVDKTDPLNQDQDDVSVMQLGHSEGEQMWINYYTDGGGFKSPVRLLNDATTGWNDNYGTDFYASKDPKVSRVWALVHDNRGGVAWAGISLKTQ